MGNDKRIEAMEALNVMYQRVAALFVDDSSKETEIVKQRVEIQQLKDNLQQQDATIKYLRRKVKELGGGTWEEYKEMHNVEIP